MNGGRFAKFAKSTRGFKKLPALALAFAAAGGSAEDRAIKSRVTPVYPELAMRLRISGPVKLEATVDSRGKVMDVKPVSGNRVLSQAAEEAVRKWQFAPARAQSTEKLTVNFELKE